MSGAPDGREPVMTSGILRVVGRVAPAGAPILLALAFSLLIALACVRHRPVVTDPAVAPAPAPSMPAMAIPAAPSADERWADSVLATMSLRARVGQMFMRWIPGHFAGPASSHFAEARRWVTQDSIGGFIISIGSPAELARKTNALQHLSKVPLFFAADLEFGPGQRLIPGGAVFPPPMGMAATGDTSASCRHGRVTAREARAVGIRWTFSPVVDLSTVPTNPIVNARAYGESAPTVIRYAIPFIRCAQENGLLATAKHFAGQGATDVDSHIGRPILDLDRVALDSGAFMPFRAAQAAGVAAIMSGHLALPKISGDSLPVTLSRVLLGDIVRDEWGFDGLLVTDALWMGGVTAGPEYTPGRGAVLAIQAGNDVILDPVDHRAMIDAIVRAVRTGTITEARIDSSVRRILIAKAAVDLDSSPLVDTAAVFDVVGASATDSIVADIAQASIVLVRDRRELVPLLPDSGDRILVLAYLDEGVEPAATVRPAEAFAAELGRVLRPSGAIVEVATTTSPSRSTELDSLAQRAARADLVILAPFARAIASKGTIGLPPAQVDFYRNVIAQQPRSIVVTFGDPYILRQIPDASTYMLAWNPWSQWSERAAARAITGRAEITGQLPVTIAPAPDLRAGAGIRMNAIAFEGAPATYPEATMALLRDTLQSLLDSGVADSTFPGAFAVVGNHQEVLASAAAGRLDWAPSPAPNEHTIWDLASLTKVVGMTTAMMQLVERGAVELDAPVVRYLPGFTGAEKATVTVRDLLTHSSGLPAWRPLYKEAESADAARALVLATPLDTVPGARYVYSDLGAILLGLIVERASGEPLDDYLAEHVFEPLEMNETGFLPDSALLPRIAPTEYDPWRQRHLRGIVHDENAFALGGVSAHAGLFSSGHDLALFARMYLNGGALGSARVFTPRTMALFTQVQDPALSHRALGWETPTGENSGGHLLSESAFGHTGFTGTSIWIDPARDLFVVLLTNRVNPTRENGGVGLVRIAVSDAVFGTLLPSIAAARAAVNGAVNEAVNGAVNGDGGHSTSTPSNP
ncbi:MAG: serine hydrolase [Gemmatimonadaceae bacterium]